VPRDLRGGSRARRSDTARALFDAAEERCADLASIPGVLYVRARHLANHGDVERAHDLLHQMAEHGLIDVWPALDPALAVLRGKERFAEFLDKVTPQ